MDLHHLRSFVAVAEELSFRRAAERLHISQPPLSRQIRALEDEVGLRLLERDRNAHVSLTDAGRTFLRDAKKTLGSAEAALRNARQTVRGSTGELRVANIPPLSATVLPPLLSAWHEAFPDVEVSLVEMEPAEQLTAVREKRVHLAIHPDLGAPLEQRFASRPLFSCRMVAVLSARHKLAASAKKEIAIESLADETILIPSTAASGYHERFDRLCAAADFTPKATHRVEGLENLVSMVAAGYGIAILPELLANSRGSELTTRRLRAPVPPFTLRLVWLRKAPSVVVQNFLDVASRWLDQTERRRELKMN